MNTPFFGSFGSPSDEELKRDTNEFMKRMEKLYKGHLINCDEVPEQFKALDDVLFVVYMSGCMDGLEVSSQLKQEIRARRQGLN